MSKRILSLVLALVMVLGTFGTVFAANTVTTEADAGAFLKKAGVLVGDENGNLNLGSNLSRQDAVILVAQLRGEIEAAKNFSKLPTYEDVKIKFYNAPLAWAQDNGLFVGHSDKVFGFGENLTAQAYAKVLLTALGYKVAPNGDSDIKWADALAKAEEFGILENLAVTNATEITRGQMALMTFNALGVAMKDSKETLADKLGIEMPAAPVEEAKELKIEKVYSENLKEVKIELSNAKLVDEAKLEDVDNYRITGNNHINTVMKATVEDNVVTLLLLKRDNKNVNSDNSLIKDKEYELLIRNIDKAVNGVQKFTAKDNTIPTIEEVKVIGEYGIKVVTSEPIANPLERNFLVDGKNVAMRVEQYGREIILTPYHKVKFADDAKTLTIKELRDYAGYKTEQQTFDIEMIKDDVAPEVVDVVVKNNTVEVTFDKDVYLNSVSGYKNRTNVGNISYLDGRVSIYTYPDNETDTTIGSEKLDTNKVAYYFANEIPRRAEFTIEGVTNHSNVKMDKVTTAGRIVVDNTEPEIINHETVVLSRTPGNASIQISLYFDKEVVGYLKTANNPADGFAASHFNVYLREVISRGLQIGKVDSVEYEEDIYGNVRRDIINVTLVGLEVNNIDKDYDYILEVKDFMDRTNSRNRMYRDYINFDIPAASTAFRVDNVYENDLFARGRVREAVIELNFTKPMNRAIAEDPTNYLFNHKNGATKRDIAQLGGKVILEGNGKRVRIEMPDFDATTYPKLEILENFKDINGARISGPRVYDFQVRALLNVGQSLYPIVAGTNNINTPALIPSATVNGNVTINYTATADLNLPVGLVINGDLTVNAPNATVNNNATVSGTINVTDVSSNTWNELVSGNKIKFNATGKTLYIAESAKPASLEITVDSNLVTSKPISAKIASGVKVTVKANADAVGAIVTGTGNGSNTNLDPKLEEELGAVSKELDAAIAKAEALLENVYLPGGNKTVLETKINAAKLAETKEAKSAALSQLNTEIENAETGIQEAKDLEAAKKEIEKLVAAKKAIKLTGVTSVNELKFKVSGVTDGSTEKELTYAQLQKPFIVGDNSDVANLVDKMVAANKIENTEEAKAAAIAKITGMTFNTSALEVKKVGSDYYLVLNGSLVDNADVAFFAPVSETEGYKVTVVGVTKISNFKSGDSTLLALN